MFFTTHIAKDHRGLIFKKGDFIRFAGPGDHFIAPGYQLQIFHASEPFKTPIALDLLLENKALAAELDVILIKQNEIALLFENEVCQGILLPGRHCFWKGVRNLTYKIFDRSNPRIPDDLDRHALRTQEVLEHIQVYTVTQFEKGALFINRKFIEALEPGDHVFWKSALSVEVFKVDLRTQQREITGQELLTKDKVTIRLNFIFQYYIKEPLKVIQQIKDLEVQIYALFQLAIRDFASAFTLDEILQKKEEAGPSILEKVKTKMQDLGVHAIEAGLKDIILPGEIREIMNQVLIAEKKAQASIITRREETASTRNMLNTVKLMEENPILLRLKELEYVERLTEKVNEINVGSGNKLVDQLKNIFLSS